MTQFHAPVLDGQTQPMPSTQNLTPYSIGTTIFTPTGKARTQRLFSGEKVTMTWQKLNNTDRNILKGKVNSAGFSTVSLVLTDGSTSLNVVPESFESYSEEKFEHLIADKVRWDVSMTWREVAI